MTKLEFVLPADIERRSFEIIESELGEMKIPEKNKPIVMRCIHTTADFDYAKNLCFSENAVDHALKLLLGGCVIVTDTNMALAGINKNALKKLGCEAVCFMAEPETAKLAENRGITRAAASVEIAAKINKPIIYAVGNAPTALVALYDHMNNDSFMPDFIIGMPVGFVNVVQSKELIMNSNAHYIVAKGRKGGSNVAAAVCNGLMYMLTRQH